jgi:hypothetical protein
MKRVEVLANIAVIVTSILLCSVLVKKYYIDKNKAGATTLANSSAGNGSSKRTVQPGSKVSLEGVDWTQASRTLVLALSTTCHFCTESAPLYRQIEQQRVNDLKIVSVFPQNVADAKA